MEIIEIATSRAASVPVREEASFQLEPFLVMITSWKLSKLGWPLELRAALYLDR